MKPVKELLSKEHLNADEYEELHELVSSWKTCAIGENRERLEALGIKFAVTMGVPHDRILADLGIMISSCVGYKDFIIARNIYHGIENYQPTTTQGGRNEDKDMAVSSSNDAPAKNQLGTNSTNGKCDGSRSDLQCVGAHDKSRRESTN